MPSFAISTSVNLFCQVFKNHHAIRIEVQSREKLRKKEEENSSVQQGHKAATANANQKVWARNAVQRRPFRTDPICS